MRASRRGARLGRFVVVLSVLLTSLPIGVQPALADANLTIESNTWNVLGLDQVDETRGPDEFLSGARVCNTGDVAATNVVATYVFDSANAYINLSGSDTRTRASLAAGSCFDVYFNVVVTRDDAARLTSRDYHIAVTADGLGTVTTPLGRELFVEDLIRQNRNSVISIAGPTTVVVGNTYTFTTQSRTAPGGYEQLASFLDWPGTIYEVQSVSVTYTAPPGATNDSVYADACGWVDDPDDVDYWRSPGPNDPCANTDNYPGGKAGGTINTTYVVKVIGAGTVNVSELIYDFSGSSFHYNEDYGDVPPGITVTAVEQADLSITKSESADPVVAGNQLTYTLSVSNAGASTATDVTVTDAVPAGTTFVSASGGGTESGGTVTWDLGNLASGASTSVSMTVDVAPGRDADLSNTASVTSATSDPDPSDNSDTETTTVERSADVSITKSDSADPIDVTDPLTYTLEVSNAGPSTATDTVVTDPLPAGMTFVSATPTTGSCAESGGTVTCSLGTLAPGATETITIDVIADPASAGTPDNTATASTTTPDPDPSNDEATESTTVVAQADLSIAKIDSSDPIDAGSPLTYTIDVRNDGPSEATNVVVTDPLPAGTTFVSATAGGSHAGGTVTWSLGTMASGDSATLQVTVQVDADRAAALSNTATVVSDVNDPDPGDNSATEGTGVGSSADLSIVKSDAVDPVAAGDDVTYTLTVTNDGPSVAQDVEVSDALPAGVSFVSATPTTGSCGFAGGTVTCDLGNLGPSDTETITLVVTTSVDGTLSNTATVSSSTTDPAPGNDSDDESTTVTPVVDVSVAIDDAPDPVLAGESLTYTLDVANDGPSSAGDVSVTLPLPAGVSFVSTTGGGVLAAGTVTWDLGTMLAGASTSVTVTVLVDPARTADLSATATVATSTFDDDASNDTDTEDTTVDEEADLGVVLTDSVDPAIPGTSFTYSIEVTNDGPSDATGVTVDLPLPAGTTFSAATAGGTETAGTVTWTIGDLAVGASTTVEVTVEVDPGATGTLNATATVSGDQADPNPANDSEDEATDLDPQADLGVSIDDGVAAVTAGTSSTYTITLTNDGPSVAPAGAVVTAPIPGAFPASETEANCQIVVSVLSCTTTVALGIGDSVSWQVTVDVPGGYAGPAVEFTAEITTFPVTDPNPANDLDTDTNAVGTLADLGVVLTDSVDPAIPGTSFTYSIEVTNDGPSDATGVTVDLPLPAGTTFSAATAGGTETAGTVTWTIGDLAVGASTTVEVTVEVDPGATGTLNATATVSGDQADPNPANDSEDEATDLDPQTDLGVVLTDSVDPAIPGTSFTYSIEVTNDGPSDATGVTVDLPLPAGTTFSAATAGGTETAGTVTWTIGDLAVGASTTVEVTVEVDPGATGTLNATATVSGDQADPNPANDSEDEATDLDPQTDLGVVLTDSVDPAIPGTSFTYSIEVTNDGPSDATGVTVDLPLPAGTTFSAATAGGTETAGTVTWTIGDLAVGASTTVEVTVEVDPGATGTLNATATVSGDQADPNPANDSEDEATDLDPQTDLGVVLTDSVDPAIPGTSFTYSIEVTNDGPSDATGVTVDLPLPAGTTFSAATAGGTETAGTVTWTIGDLAVGASTTVEVTVEVDPGATGTLNATATVSGDQADPNPANDSEDEATDLDPQTDLGVVLTDSVDPAIPGTSFTYSIEVTNDGPSDATGVTVDLPLPAGTTFSAATAGGTETAGTVTWTIGDLAVGASTTVEVTVEVDPGATGTLNATATVSGDQADPNPANDSEDEATDLDPQADLGVSIDDGVAAVTAGTSSTYTITLTNDGPSVAPAGAVVTAPIPGAFPASETEANCQIVVSVLSCTTTVALGIGDSVSWQVTVDVPGGYAGPAVEFTAEITTFPVTDPNPANDLDTDTNAVGTLADLGVVLTDSVDPAIPGTSFTYSIEVTNDGPSDATGVTVDLPLPAGTTFSAATAGGTETAGTVTWTIGDLAVGASTTVEVTVEVDPGATGTLNATATVSGDQADPNPANDSEDEATDLDPQTDLGVVLTDSVDPAIPGTSFTYSIEVTNDGPSDATGVTVDLPLPAGTTFSAATAGGTETAGTVTWTIGDLAVGASTTVEVTVEVDPGATGTLNATATVSGDQADPNPANDSEDEATDLDPQTDLGVVLTDSVDPAIPGTSFTYSIEVTNDGPSDATGVTVDLPLPAGTTFSAATAGGTETAGTVTWTIGDLAVGASTTVEVTVEVDPGATGTLNATATVSGDQADPNPANDSEDEATDLDPQTDLGVVLTDSVDPAIPGTSFTYSIEVTNDGPSDATGVTVDLPLPAGTTFSAATAGGTETAGTVTWTIGDLAVGASTTVEVTVEVDPGATGTLNATATVSGDQADPNPANDSEDEATDLDPQADLGVSIDDGVAAVTAGTSSTYTITLTNDGPSVAPAGAVVTAPIPGAFPASETEANCQIVVSVLSCTTTVALGIGDSVSWQVTVDVPGGYAGPAVEFTAEITTFPVTDPNPANDLDTDTNAVGTLADLGVVLTDSVDPAIPGTSFTYSIEVTNDGPSDATGVTVDLPLPAGTTFSAATAGGTETAGTVTWTIGDLAVGASTTVEVTVEVDPGATGTLNATATVSGDQADPNPANDSEDEATDLDPQTDLGVVLTDSVDPAIPGTSFTYSIEVTNDGPSDATGVTVDLPLPAGTTFSAATAGGTETAGTVTWTIGDLAVGASTTVEVTVEVDPGATGTLNATATVSGDQADPNPANDSEDEATDLDPQTDLGVVLTDSVDPAIPGTSFTYSIEVTNDGPSDATGVTVDLPLPAGTTFSAATAGGTETAGTVTWTIGDLAVGASTTVEVTVEVDPGATGTLNATATVSGDQADPNPANDSEDEATDLDPQTDLGVSIDDAPDPAAVGETVTYTLTVTNDGPSDATGVVVTNILPADSTFASVSGTQGVCVHLLGIVTCGLGDVPAGGTVEIAIEVTATADGVITDQATVSAATADPNAANDQDQEETEITPVVDLGIAVTDDPDPVAAGTELVYTVDVTNGGPSAGTDVVATFDVPAGVSFVSASGGGVLSGGTVTWTIGDLPVGDVHTFEVIVEVDPDRTADLHASTSVSGSRFDADPSNDDADASTAVSVAVDLVLTKDDGTTTVIAGTSTSYTLTLTNDGPSTLPAGAVVTDLVPGGTEASEDEASCQIAAGEVTCVTVAPLTPGASVSWVVELQVDPGYVDPTLTNVASVVAVGATELDPSDDTALDVDDVVREVDAWITVRDLDDPVDAGGQITYVVRIGNAGPSDATGLVATLTLPDGVTFASATDGGSAAGGVVMWPIGTLAPGQVVAVRVTVDVDLSADDQLVAEAEVTGDPADVDPANDLDAEPTIVRPQVADIAISKDVDDPTPMRDQVVRYTVRVRNLGPSDATGLVIGDRLPAGLELVDVRTDRGTYDSSSGLWAIGDLAVGDEAEMRMWARVVAGERTVRNVAWVETMNQTDTNGDNDRATRDVISAAPPTAHTGGDLVPSVLAMLLLMTLGGASLVASRRRRLVEG